MEYGFFDKEKKEYVITNLKTPVRWINYVGTLNFGGFVDQMGGALLCKGDPAFNRISKYIPGLPNSEMNGTAFYIRVRNGGGYSIFSPFYVPCCSNPDKFECHVGLLYTKIYSEMNGVALEITFFTPQDGEAMVMDCHIKNISGGELEIDFIPVVEYTHFEALKQFANADWVPQTMISRVEELSGGNRALIQYAFMNRDTNHNFFVANRRFDGFETDRAIFLGSNGYGSWAAPESLHSERLSDSIAERGDNIGAMMFRLGSMPTGAEERIILQLGQTEEIKNFESAVAPLFKEDTVDKAFADLGKFWDGYLNSFVVNTPSPEMDNMLNVHHPKQCYITKNWSRYLSSYQLGLGARGLGMRDSSQDLLGVMAHMPEEALILLKTLISKQRPNGSAYHQYFPKTGEASEGDSQEMEDRPSWYGDDHLWFIVSLAAYIRETGNFAVLSEEIPFYTKENEPKASGTIKEHVLRALEFTQNNKGAHGLPLLGFADWNDCVNLRTGAESTFNASLFGVALNEMIALFTTLKETVLVKKFTAYHDEMKIAVNEKAWDGKWFIRYFDSDGSPLGSNKNEKGKIYQNGQTWPIMAGFAEIDRAKTALKSVFEKLNTEHGIKISWPGYDGYDKNLGGISTYPPGAKENGGIFVHPNPWAMIAETIVGNGDRAFQYYNQINPAAKESDLYECEPYCYAQNILSNEHPKFGLARNSWLSGTAAWVYRAATWHILGIRPGFNGLEIDPCIPKDWKGFSVKRKYRGAFYHISVINASGNGSGVNECYLNGNPVEATAIPVATPGQTVEIKIVL